MIYVIYLYEQIFIIFLDFHDKRTRKNDLTSTKHLNLLSRNTYTQKATSLSRETPIFLKNNSTEHTHHTP